jgi:hypothetical protein
MTDLRQAAQQALEALENSSPDQYPEDAGVFYDAITALRTALEQQAEPGQWRDMVVVNLVREGVNKHKARELADHFAAPPQQQAEPASGCDCRWDHKDVRVATCKRHQGWFDVIAEWADRAREAEAKLKAAQPEQQPKPVTQCSFPTCQTTGGCVGTCTRSTQPTPPQRKPLTDELYNELLFAVGSKYPDETRHQTALRYIKRAEMRSASPAKAAHGIKEEM